MMAALDLAYLNSAAYEARLREIYTAERFDALLAVIEHDEEDEWDCERHRNLVLAALRCDLQDLRGLLAIMDASRPEDAPGSEMARILGLEIGVTAVAHWDEAAGMVEFWFTHHPDEGRLPC